MTGGSRISKLKREISKIFHLLENVNHGQETLEELVSGHNIWETFKEFFMNYEFVEAF